MTQIDNSIIRYIWIIGFHKLRQARPNRFPKPVRSLRRIETQIKAEYPIVKRFFIIFINYARADLTGFQNLLGLYPKRKTMNSKHTLAKLAPGKRYHIYTRGNNRETIFKRPENYLYFLRLWKLHISPIAETYAYCLLANHVHFCIRILSGEELPKRYQVGERNLSQPFSNCLNAYTKAINKRYQRTGSLFEETYRRKHVGSETYLIRLIAYIHANPQHHGLCEDFRKYPYSSYHSLLSPKPTALLREEIWDCFGSRQGFKEFHADHKNWRSLIEKEMDLEN